jgi:hypothetical protein
LNMPNVTFGHVQSSLRPCSPVSMVTLHSLALITQKMAHDIL